jgi:hypothetical protein
MVTDLEKAFYTFCGSKTNGLKNMLKTENKNDCNVLEYFDRNQIINPSKQNEKTPE